MRRLICLFLVACLLFSAWAVPTKAFVITGTAVMGSLGVAVSILAGLGLTVYTIDKISSWTSLVSQAQSHLNDQGLLDSDGNMQLLYSDGLTYLPVSVIQSLKDWFFDSGSISQSHYSGQPGSGSFSFGSYYFNYSSAESNVYFYPLSWKDLSGWTNTMFLFISSSTFGLITNASNENSLTCNGLYHKWFEPSSYSPSTTAPSGFLHIGTFDTRYGVSSVLDYIDPIYSDDITLECVTISQLFFMIRISLKMVSIKGN